MKRIWFAVIFLSFCTALCIGEQAYVKKSHESLTKKISYTEKNPSNENVKDLLDYYSQIDKKLFTMCESERLAELTEAINSISTDDEEIKLALHQAQIACDNFYNLTKLKLSNIL